MFNFTRSQLVAAYVIVGIAFLGMVGLVARSGVFAPTGSGIKFIEPGGDAPKPDLSAGSTEEIPAAAAEICVHVAGKVNKPGLYKLKPGGRVLDAIEAAGGATANADLETINLAEELADGQQVYIAPKGQITPPKRSVIRGGSQSKRLPDAGPDKGSSSPRKLTKPGEGTVNINTAGLEELQRLPGIGPAMAQRIIDYRTEHGRFKAAEELVEVRGIGPKTLAKMRPFVTL